MVVPDFQSIMLPLLKIAGDSKEHTLSEVIDILSSQFHLSDEDRKELLPSGRQQKFVNRVGWSRTYLKKAGFLESTVGRPVVQAFAGSLMGLMARKGVLIATSQFSQEARDYVDRIDKKIVLIDGEELAQLMIDHGIGVAEVTSYTVKKLDLDYFGEE